MSAPPELLLHHRLEFLSFFDHTPGTGRETVLLVVNRNGIGAVIRAGKLTRADGQGRTDIKAVVAGSIQCR